MTAGTFDYAKSRGTFGNIGQLAPMERFAAPEEVSILLPYNPYLPSC